jgi:hypothetical protein
MNATLFKFAVLLGIGLYVHPSSGWTASTEEVVLNDGKSYEILTENGVPIPFKGPEIEVMGLGPLFHSAEKAEWAFTAILKARGKFTVTATTPLDPRVSLTFECVGPGKIIQFIFGKDEYPRLWEWYEDPSTSWVPIVFIFKNNESEKSFQVMQWTKFDPSVKVLIRQKLKEASELHRP